MLTYACYASVVVGHWPYYAHPDPKELPLSYLLSAVSWILLLGLASVILIPLGYGTCRLIARWRKTPFAVHRAAVGFYLAGAILWTADISAEFTRLPWKSLAGWVID